MEIAIKNFFLILISLVSFASLQAEATTYYVDSGGGSDSNSGTSTNLPWASLSKVNGTTFLPGDYILFKAGGIWSGTTQLNPKGSGSTNNPVIIDMYGTGPKPVINSSSTTGNGVVYLSNQQYWEINNLELTSDANSDGDRRGVYFSGSSGILNHLYLRNCYIHNIRGTFSASDAPSAKRTGGMLVEDLGSTSFNDILIENNVFTTVRQTGIMACLNANSAKYVIIRGNVISDVAKNAVIIHVCDNTCLIEHNLCFNTANKTTGNTMFTAQVDGAVFQYNEGYMNLAGDHDGSLYDADLNSKNVVFQYSYSHDNSHGLFWQYGGSTSDTGNLCRYNISQNDQGNIFSFSGSGGTDLIYNNTVYIPSTNKAPTNPPQHIVDDRSSGHKEYFYNNIIYNQNPAAIYNFTSGNTHTFDYNNFYGQHPGTEPSDTHKLISDPMMVAPGTGGTNSFGSLLGYALQAGSPCIDSGTLVGNNGNLDFFSNSVPYNGVTDRGAYEWHGAVLTNPPPLVISQPVGIEVCAGGTAVFNVVATNFPLSYQWRKSGGNIANQTNTSLTLNNVSSTDASNFDVVITNAYGFVTSSVAVLTVDSGVPIISQQPASLLLPIGSTANFSVTAIGGLNLGYQWRKSGVVISGANSPGFNLANITTNEAAMYDVVVVNNCGSVTSSAVVLTINSNVSPAITLQPLNQTACLGSALGFSVGANGTAPLYYQWRKAGVAINGSTNLTLDFGSVTNADSASYDVVITNALGSVTSSVVTLTILLPPAISSAPTNQTVNVGATVSFSLLASGSIPLSYQWRKNNSNIASATNAILTLNSVTSLDASNYDVVISNGCGAVTSSVATLTLNPVVSTGTNIIAASSRATVRDGVNYNLDIDELTAGYVMVKYSTTGSAAKGYFQFDLTGQNPDTTLPAIFSFVTVSSSGAQRLQLWGLNQFYPGMSNNIIWANAQANETNTDNMLTNGPTTASMIGTNALLPASTTSNSITIPAPWGQFLQSNKVVLVYTAASDVANSSSGYRILVTNASQQPSFTFGIISNLPPVPLTLPASGINASSATLNGIINPQGMASSWYFRFGLTSNYGSYTPTNTTIAGTSSLGVSNIITGLSSGTGYHYQLQAVSSAGSASGGDLTFSALNVTAPKVKGLFMTASNAFNLSFTNTPGGRFSVYASTNMLLYTSNWTFIGLMTEGSSGQFSFGDLLPINRPQRFYQVRSP